MKKRFSGLLLLFFAVSALTLHSKPVEIAVGDTGFEDIKNGRPEKYNVTGGELHVSTEKRSGKYGGKYVMAKGVPLNALWIRHDFQTPVRYGDTYTISVWAKGKGRIAYLISGYSGSLWKRSIWGRKYEPLTSEWKRYSWKFRIDFDYMNNVRPGFEFQGDGYAILDDISMTYDPADNNGRILPVEAPRKTILPFQLSFRDSAGTIRINGKETKKLELGEGLNVLEIALRPTGKNPSFTLNTPAEFTLCRQAWKEAPSGSVTGDTSSAKYDDRAWREVQPDKSGRFIPRNKKKPTVFRTVLLWNHDYYAKESMLRRRQKEWLLPAGSVQLLHFELAPETLDRTYKKSLLTELYLPDGVSLMNMKQTKSRYVLNQEPQVQNCGKVKIDGKSFQKYLLTWTPQQLKKYKNSNQYPESRIPLRVSHNVKKGKTASIRFGRLAKGRFAEVIKKIPVRFYPPVNGRQPKQIMIQLYASAPLSAYSPFPEKVLYALVEQAGKIGVNSILGGRYFHGYEFMETWLNRAYDKAGVKRFVWTNSNFPLHSMYIKGVPDIYERHKKMPDAQAKYFPTRATVQWGAHHVTSAMYCPSYMLDVPEGKKFFAEMVEKGLKHEIQTSHKPVGVFFDYEQDVWRSIGKIPGNGSYCFCDRCRSLFQKRLKLSVLPTPHEIREKYYKQWEQFRINQDRRLNAVLHNICKKLGMKMMYYTQKQMHYYFTSSEGPFDYLFIGYPERYAITRGSQAEQDKYCANLKPHYQGMIAQVLPDPSKMGYGTASDGRPDGFYVPSRWKSIILRLIATYRYGVDIAYPTEFNGGIGYYIGEATRAVAELEDFFVKGKRADVCPEIANMKYPDILGLEWNGKKIVLLFNESTGSKTVKLNLKGQIKARTFYSQIKNDQIVIPPENAEILILEKK